MRYFYEWESKYSDERGRFDFGMMTDFSFSAHWHNAMEFIYVAEGEVLIGIDDEKRIARAGDIVLCGSGRIHYANSLENGSKMILIIFDPAFVAGLMHENQFAVAFLDAQKMRELAIPPEEIAEIRHCFSMLSFEEELQFKDYRRLCENYLVLLIGLLLRRVPLKQEDAANQPIGSTVMTMQRAIEYIAKHYNSNITLESLAEHLYISPFYLSRLFSRFTGKPFKVYLNHIRVAKAKYLMAATSDSVLDIALKCGFNNIRTFNRAFREHTNTTPTAYMKAKRM